jgi:lysophospholipase L1-like esterase
MRRKSLYHALVIALAVALAGITAGIVAGPARLAQAATPVKIMPLGDSITGSPGCWRALLWNMLQQNGYTNIDFVGTLPPQGCGVTYDGDNEGHGGILATGIVSANQLPGWLASTRPDIVMMHLGTNDVWNNIAPATILAAFSTMVDQMRASNASMKILVAKIIPMNPSNCAECAARVVAFDAAIPAWAAGKSTAQSPIVVVDQWTGFNDATDTGDGVHPNDAGNQKMSSRWYPPLAAYLSPSGTGSPTPSPTRSVSPTPSPTRSVSPSPSVSPTRSPSPSVSPTRSPSPTPDPTGGTSGCSASYQISSQWPGGFQSSITVTNNGSAALSGWTVRFSFANGQVVSQSWNATVTQSGAAVTATSMTYNGALAAHASTAFGFLASWTSSNAVPTAITCGSP